MLPGDKSGKGVREGLTSFLDMILQRVCKNMSLQQGWTLGAVMEAT